MALTISSPAFTDSTPLPSKYSLNGGNVSPPIRWTDAPANTKSLALICDDPDAPAGDWVHWVVWNIPASAKGLSEGMARTTPLPDGTRQGTTDFGKVGYDGPAPPSGTHRYFFKLFALDTTLDLPTTARKPDLLRAMKGHIIAQVQVMGTFARAR